MSDIIYTRFVCDSPNNGYICANPLCNKETNNPKYCSLSCGTQHRNMLDRIKKEQEYYQTPKYCLKCDATISYKGRMNKFCSKSCATFYNSKFKKPRKPVTDEFRQKMRDIRLIKSLAKPKVLQLCLNCNGLFYHKIKKKTCSDVCYKSLHSNIMKDYIKVTPSHKFNRSPIKRSWMERTFEEWLNKYGINYGFTGYLTEVKFWNPETKKNGRADFVFPKFKLIIELDGTHHNERKDLDDIRDSYLLTRGWTVFRIGYKEYKKKTKVDYVKQLLSIK